ERAGRFTVEEIIAGLTAKLKRRHPHVFGTERAGSARAALFSYRRAKRLEKKTADSGAASRRGRRPGI
ncbi:MAG TPA: MazG nucleotide pyrophosphohydrolase domain-containing protein, partial [bacterium]|nr:MazG nucleotide pyrophosphohydrolase domain-containing protein [bacterium]